MIWNSDNVPIINLPDPTGYGWSKRDGDLIPVVSLLKPAPKAILELVRCKCVAGRCSRGCSCSNNGQSCTDMCRCEGNQDKCDNAEGDSHSATGIDGMESSDEDDDDVVEYVFPYQSTCTDTLLAYSAYDVQEEEADNVVPLTVLEMDLDSICAV